mmetsp:Transcript_52045/g.82757  ORF Transcript_52045/g.82757 Transcript_52045/m.82757 type:complete len:142 (+) Transcript_52045:85-510(+)
MPRQSARAAPPTRSAPPPSHGNTAPPPPRQQTTAPPPASAPMAAPPAPAPSQGGGMLSGLMGSMASGMATGVGMSVANRAVDAVMGPRQTEVVHRHEGAPPAPAVGPCQMQQDQLNQCMKGGDASACQFYLDSLKACQQSA